MFRKNNMDNREYCKFHAELLWREYGNKKKQNKKKNGMAEKKQ